MKRFNCFLPYNVIIETLDLDNQKKYEENFLFFKFFKNFSRRFKKIKASKKVTEKFCTILFYNNLSLYFYFVKK